MNAGLASIRDAKTILLTTYKRVGARGSRLMRYRTMHYELVPQ
jgi:hypothetical protein